MNSVTASTTTAFIGVKSPNVTTPDADLRAVDSQGRVTGVTEDGEFVNEIPGAKASGDRIQGPEWISVPSDADVEFEVSTADTQQFVNETNVSAENATISYTTEVTEVGENPQLVTENGTVTVTNTTTTTTNQSAEPGETKEVSTGFSVAEFDRDGDDQIGFDDLRFALREFNNGNLTFDQLRRILQAYNTGASV
jgi:Ca2+-binding EF-hand superfamily protein